jgi:hypothetical protein
MSHGSPGNFRGFNFQGFNFQGFQIFKAFKFSRLSSVLSRVSGAVEATVITLECFGPAEACENDRAAGAPVVLRLLLGEKAGKANR